MTSLADLAQQCANLSKLFKAKSPPAIPKKVLNVAAKTLSRLINILGAYSPPGAAEKKAAKAHPISSQIITFTSAKERKNVFTDQYFKKQIAALPKDKDVITASQKDDLNGLLESILIYHYRNGKNDGFKGLREFRETLERDYYNKPAVIKAERAGDLVIDLMRMDDVRKIAAILKKKFSKRASLEAFATQNGLKIPTQKKSRQEAKKTPHELLAEIIYSAGAPARL